MSETSVVNTHFVGRTYPPSGPYAVSAADIAAFAGAVGSDDPMHRDAETKLVAGVTSVDELRAVGVAEA